MSWSSTSRWWCASCMTTLKGKELWVKSLFFLKQEKKEDIHPLCWEEYVGRSINSQLVSDKFCTLWIWFWNLEAFWATCKIQFVCQNSNEMLQVHVMCVLSYGLEIFSYLMELILKIQPNSHPLKSKERIPLLKMLFKPFWQTFYLYLQP
jgi:hypothetical protein